MAFDGDPYRTLGLARGASLDEVKRAYRRLAKANHPDAVGQRGAAPASWRSRRPTSSWSEGSGGAPASGRAIGAVGRARPAGLRGRPGPGRGHPTSVRRPGASRRSPDARPGRRRSGIPALTSAGGHRRTPVRPDQVGGTAARQGDARLDLVRRRRRRAGRAGLERRQLVRDDQRDVLDDQPEGVRRSAQARAGVPGACPAGVGRPVRRDARRAPASAAPDREHGPPPGSADRRPPGPVGGRRGPVPTPRPPADRRTEPTDEPVPDPAQAMATLARALTDPRTGRPFAVGSIRAVARLAAHRARPRLAARRADRLRPVRRHLRSGGRPADPVDPGSGAGRPAPASAGWRRWRPAPRSG